MIKKDANGWIDVQRHTPYFDTSVLIYTTGRGVQIGYLDSETDTFIGPDYCGYITHWQPLLGKPIGIELSQGPGSNERGNIQRK